MNSKQANLVHAPLPRLDAAVPGFGAMLPLVIAAVALTAAATVAVAQPSGENVSEGFSGLAGDPDRGRVMYTTEYKCYACHGFDAQTGERRLVPMRYTQEGFIEFVQQSPLPQMPAYPDMPAQALADVYAYIRSIPVDAPEVEEIPILNELLEEKRQALAQ